MTEYNEEHNNEELNEEYVNFDEEPAEEQTSPVEDELPEKYQGKTPAELAKMHQEAEKMMGRQSSEVGELRKIVDDFVKVQLSTQQQSRQQESYEAYDDDEEELDFFEDPNKAIDRAIRKHPKVREAEQITAQLKQQEAVARLKAAHPDFADIVQDTNFQEWVKKSKIRTRLLQEADSSYDFDSADELLTTWKERQNIVKEAATTETAARKQQVKQASTGAARGTGEAQQRKVYRRADIIKLMQTDPDRYMALAGEIRKAYAEGRVR
jgi:hypothetical protein